MADTHTGNGITPPSISVDMSGASRVEAAPPNGQYDATIINVEVREGKQRPDEPPTQSLYANVQLQINTDPARGRTVFDMLLIRLKDGSLVGTSAAYQRNYTQPFILGQLLDLFKLPSTVTLGPIEALKGKQFRGVFRAEDDNGEPRLKLRKVVGPPTGKGFTAKPTATRAADVTAEDFS